MDKTKKVKHYRAERAIDISTSNELLILELHPYTFAACLLIKDKPKTAESTRPISKIIY